MGDAREEVEGDLREEVEVVAGEGAGVELVEFLSQKRVRM